MNSPTPATAAESVRRGTAAPQWSPSQQLEISALQSGRWWPFQKADAKVLAYLHKQHKPEPIEYKDALL